MGAFRSGFDRGQDFVMHDEVHQTIGQEIADTDRLDLALAVQIFHRMAKRRSNRRTAGELDIDRDSRAVASSRMWQSGTPLRLIVRPTASSF